MRIGPNVRLIAFVGLVVLSAAGTRLLARTADGVQNGPPQTRQRPSMMPLIARPHLRRVPLEYQWHPELIGYVNPGSNSISVTLIDELRSMPFRQLQCGGPQRAVL